MCGAAKFGPYSITSFAATSIVGGHGEEESVRGLEVDYQLELGRVVTFQASPAHQPP
jgi:hypothetical protein